MFLDSLTLMVICSPQSDHGCLSYLDTSTGLPITEHRTKMGALHCMTHNPRNGIVHLGHQNGMTHTSQITQITHLHRHSDNVESQCTHTASQTTQSSRTTYGRCYRNRRMVYGHGRYGCKTKNMGH